MPAPPVVLLVLLPRAWRSFHSGESDRGTERKSSYVGFGVHRGL
jgi:hypothetical protein